MRPSPHGAAPVTDLPERLRLETRDLHALSERSGVMASLLRGQLARADYIALLRNLHALYAALEAALNRHTEMPALAVLGAPALHREAALASDLDALCGPDWPATVPVAAATQTYVARLRALADTEPLALAAHAYVRYLGDLHGGQVLKRLVAPSLALAGDAARTDATRFYEFGAADDVLALRLAFRAGLSSLSVDTAAADRLVAEARWAFEQHVRLFNELAAVSQRQPPPNPQPAANDSA